MSFEKPPIAKYLEQSSKAVDLVNLCRRLIAEWQYHDTKPFGVFEGVCNGRSNATTRQKAFELMEAWFSCNRSLEMTKEILDFVSQLPVSIYTSRTEVNEASRITAKEFKSNLPTKPEELLGIYWRLRMHESRTVINEVLGQLVEDLKKLKYDGFLLPNGKMVPFESVQFATFWFSPKELTLIDCQLPKCLQRHLQRIQMYTMIEGLFKSDSAGDFLSKHVVIALNLPETDEQGNLGRLMIIDPTCAQFGMKGSNGELLYWGYYEDYVKKFPAKKLVEEDIVFNKYVMIPTSAKDHEGFALFCSDVAATIRGLRLKEAALSNMDSDFCGYCGEAERKENPEMKLKKCSKCKEASYCDALCQKLAWKSHKLECKSN